MVQPQSSLRWRLRNHLELRMDAHELELQVNTCTPSVCCMVRLLAMHAHAAVKYSGVNLDGLVGDHGENRS
jgi:hypothetical protein